MFPIKLQNTYYERVHGKYDNIREQYKGSTILNYYGNLLLISFIWNWMFFENEVTNIQMFYLSYVT